MARPSLSPVNQYKGVFFFGTVWAISVWLLRDVVIMSGDSKGCHEHEIPSRRIAKKHIRGINPDQIYVRYWERVLD